MIFEQLCNRSNLKNLIILVGENIYALDPTTIGFVLLFSNGRGSGRRKMALKYTLSMISKRRFQFIHITTAPVHNNKVMKKILYEQGSYYILIEYTTIFKEFHKITLIEAFFAVNAKKNLQYRTVK